MSICIGSLEYRSCHEAGHAIARVVVTGATLRRVYAINCVTEYENKSWRCTCAVGFFAPGEGGHFTFAFDPVCATCAAYVIDQLVANYAGAVATGILMPSDHQLRDMEGDVAAAGEFSQSYALHLNIWKAIKTAALEKADSLVHRETGAVLALKNALISNGGVLDDPMAESIIAANRGDAQNGAQNRAH